MRWSEVAEDLTLQSYLLRIWTIICMPVYRMEFSFKIWMGNKQESSWSAGLTNSNNFMSYSLCDEYVDH